MPTHSLPAGAFEALAGGAGDIGVVSELRGAQLSKNLMLLHVIGRTAAIDPPSAAAAAFRGAYQLLTEAQAADPGAVARLLGLPHFGSWAHDCFGALDVDAEPDFGYLAGFAAAAAVGIGLGFELAVPVRGGRVILPGLGYLRAGGAGEWITLSSDGTRLRAGEDVDVACAALVPDDGTAPAEPHWQGTPLVRAEAGGQAWEVLLETADPYLDRYELPMITDMTAAECATWRRRVQEAWELLVRHHGWVAGPVARGVPVIVPVRSRSDLDSATFPAAFGAIATSLPPSAVSLGETLVHEFQHTKLCGLLDMLPSMVAHSDGTNYVPWRDDPRPVGGVLQGLYAFAGIVRFWERQRRVETEADAILRASVLYERWRGAVELVSGSLLSRDCLTPVGAHFVTVLREQARSAGTEPVPAQAAQIATEVALDNWLTWQLTHTAFDVAGVARLADAYRCGEPASGQSLPRGRIEADTRKVDSVPRSKLLNMRYQDPARFRRSSVSDLPGLGAADASLIRGDASAAVTAYREALAAEPDPAAWIGLALALRRLSALGDHLALTERMPLLFEVHESLAARGMHADPLDLADWLG